MPGIRLDLEIDDKGTAVIKRFSQTVRKELGDVERTADRSLDKTEKGLKKVGDAAGRSSTSFATLTGNVLKAAPAFAVATAAISGVYMAMRKLRDEFTGGLKAVEDYNLRVASMTAFMTTFSKAAAEGNIAKGFQESNDYAKELVKTLEIIDAKTVATGKDLSIMAETMIQNGVLLDINNQKQVEGFTSLANALKLMTKGMNQEVQIRQETRALLQGQLRDTNVLVKLLQAIDPEIKEHLKTWKEQGVTLERIGGLLSGFNASTSLIEMTWEAIGTTLETIHDRVLRGAFKPIYEDLLDLALQIKDAFMDANGELTPLAKNIQEAIQDAWDVFKGVGKVLLLIVERLKQTYDYIKIAQIPLDYLRGKFFEISEIIIDKILPKTKEWVDLLKRLPNVISGRQDLMTGKYDPNYATKQLEEQIRYEEARLKNGREIYGPDFIRAQEKYIANLKDQLATTKAFLEFPKLQPRLKSAHSAKGTPPELIGGGEFIGEMSKELADLIADAEAWQETYGKAIAEKNKFERDQAKEREKSEEEALRAAQKRYRAYDSFYKEEQSKLAERGRLIAEQRKLEEKIALSILPEHERRIKEIQIKYRELREDVQRAYDFDLSFNLEDIEKRQAALADLAQREREEIQKTNEEWRKKQLKLDEYQKAFQHFLDNLHDAGVDFFRSLLDGGINSWKDALDAFKNYFKQFLAELLALAIARPITISIVGSVAGSLGLGDIAGAATGTGGGGMSIFNTLRSGLSSGGSFLGTVQDLWSWEWIQDGAMSMVNFSDSLDGVANAFSNFGAFIEGLPIIGNLGLGGTLQGFNAISQFSQGNNYQAALSTIGAGLSYVNPLFGAAWSLGTWIGSNLFGGGKDTPSAALSGPAYFRDGQVGWNIYSRADFGNAGTSAQARALTVQMNETFDQIAHSWEKILADLSKVLGDRGEDWLAGIDKSFNISTWNWVDENFGQEFAKSINQQFYNNLVPTFNQMLAQVWTQAKTEMRDLDAWQYMSTEWIANLNKMITELPRLEWGGDPQENLSKITNFIKEVQGIQVWMLGVAALTAEIDMAVRGDSISEFEKAWIAINTQFDQWAAKLTEMGVDLEKYTTLEEGRQQALNRLFGGAFDDIQDVIDKHELSDQAYRIKKGLPEIQKWYDQQLAMLDFLRGEGRITEDDYAGHLADLNKAMAYKVQDLQSSFGMAYESLKNFFDEMTLSDLAPGQSMAAFKQQYETLLQGGLSEELLNFIKGEYLPFARAYTGGAENYNTLYAQIMADLRNLAPAADDDDPGFDEQMLTQALYNAIMAVKAEGGDVGDMHFHIMIDGREIARVVNEQYLEGNIVL